MSLRNAPLYELDNEEVTKHRTKPNNPNILISEMDKGRENKGVQNKGNEEDGKDWEKKTTAKMYELDSEDELNGDIGMLENDDYSDNDNKEHTCREKVRPIKNTKES